MYCLSLQVIKGVQRIFLALLHVSSLRFRQHRDQKFPVHFSFLNLYDAIVAASSVAGSISSVGASIHLPSGLTGPVGEVFEDQ